MEDFAVCKRIQRGITSPLYAGPGHRHQPQVPANLFRWQLVEVMRTGIASGSG
jgi:hypothetical protein